ncbi:DUF692 domain-containing protein [Ideonella azotifigens]|uniref:DUF692 domain-containing protein n=1 Tax=Ideonella azotifigens TaxID=513160 RepID=A0ABN1JN91_9BURK|nr:DUF692 domain-containing protein [Ideonella azotifigens]MCD2339924.1 DUF692 domain-containing protein [Ideonella azotifigens]
MPKRDCNPHCLGVGLNHRHEIEAEIIDRLDELDLLEVISDNILQDEQVGEPLRRLMRDKPLVLHGVSTSLGTAAPLDPDHLAATLQAVERWQPLWFSDHIAFSRVGELDVGHLMPVRRSLANQQRIAAKIRQIQQASATPFLVENITYYFEHGDEEMDELSFVNGILQQADCGLLLDVNNLHINAQNHRFDPYEYLAGLDLGRVVELHLAGGFVRDELLIDSHGHRIGEPVWELLRHVCERAQPRAIIIERDINFDLADIFDSVARAREILLQTEALAA